MKPAILDAVEKERATCAEQLFRGDLSRQLRSIERDENRWIEVFVANVTNEDSSYCSSLRSCVGWHEMDTDPFNSLSPHAWDILTLAKPRERWWAFAISRLHNLSNKKILDIGGGTALLARVLHRTGIDIDVTLVDLSNKWTNYAAELDIQGLNVVCQDIQSYTSSELFDAAFSFMAFHHIEDSKKAFDAVRRNLAAGAIFSLTDKIGLAKSTKDRQRVIPHPPAPEWIRSIEQTRSFARDSKFKIFEQEHHASNVVNLYCKAC